MNLFLCALFGHHLSAPDGDVIDPLWTFIHAYSGDDHLMLWRCRRCGVWVESEDTLHS